MQRPSFAEDYGVARSMARIRNSLTFLVTQATNWPESLIMTTNMSCSGHRLQRPGKHLSSLVIESHGGGAKILRTSVGTFSDGTEIKCDSFGSNETSPEKVRGTDLCHEGSQRDSPSRQPCTVTFDIFSRCSGGIRRPGRSIHQPRVVGAGCPGRPEIILPWLFSRFGLEYSGSCARPRILPD